MPATRFAPCIIRRIRMNPTDHLRSDQKFPPREASRSCRTNSGRRTDARYSEPATAPAELKSSCFLLHERVGPKAAVDG